MIGVTCVLFFSTLLGFTALALAMPRHAKQVLGMPLPQAWHRALRAGGWLLLAAALTLGIRQWGIDVGIVAWLGWLSLTGLAVTLSLPYWALRSRNR